MKKTKKTPKLKKYFCSWEERHSRIITAESEEAAKEKILSGDSSGSDESAEYSGGIEAQEIDY